MTADPQSLNSDDCLNRFLLRGGLVRGAWVDLSAIWTKIQESGDYPANVQQILGKTCASAGLFTANTKLDGRLSVQLKGTAAIKRVFAECSANGSVRAIAKHEGSVPQFSAECVGHDALLAITMETKRPGQAEIARYQGLVSLDQPSLEACFEQYFAQSEQLATRIVLAVDGQRARGLMLQQMPKTAENRADSEDCWLTVEALLHTLEADELMQTEPQTLLWRLFQEESVAVLDSKKLHFACTCSADKVAEVIVSIGINEAMASLEDGLMTVACEFCGQKYEFAESQIHRLFSQMSELPPAPSSRLH